MADVAHILVVDNIPDHLYLARSLFEARGYVISTFSKADEALKFLRSNSVDVIVSDINMPDKDGFEFLREVKADPALRQITFVLLTASYWTDQVRKDGLALGADKFLFRPFEPRVLVTEIEEVIPQEKRGTNPLPGEA